jgi:hypothetical protein
VSSWVARSALRTAVALAAFAPLPAAAAASWSNGGYFGVGDADGCVSFDANDSALLRIRVGGCHWLFTCGANGSRGAPAFGARRIALPRSGSFSRHVEDNSGFSAPLIWDVSGTVNGTTATGTFRFHYGPVCDTGSISWRAERLVKIGRTCNSARLGLGRVRAAAGDSCRLRHRVVRKRFPGCAAAAGYIRAHPNGIAEAESSFPLEPELMTWENAGGEPRASVGWKLGPKAFLAEPRFTWPHMTASEQGKLDAWERGVDVHEHGHLTVARQFTEARGRRQFRAPTAAELNEKLKAYAKKTERDLQERSDEYDRVTKHGAMQHLGPAHGFPGGQDTVFSC